MPQVVCNRSFLNSTSRELTKDEMALKKKVHDKFSKPYGESENLRIRKLLMKVDHKDSTAKLQKVTLGSPSSVQIMPPEVSNRSFLNSKSRDLTKDEMALKKKVHDEFSKPYGESENLRIRKLLMKEDHKDSTAILQKVTLGSPSPHRPTKVILLVGATGTGKTTLINAMVNFIFRINFEDDFRFILIDDKDAPKRSQAESQTDLITAYVFNYLSGMPFEYNYVLIDTPGFGDTRGIQRDREMMHQLEMFLKQNYGIDQVDGVGFVTPSSAARLTQTQRYVFDGLSSMFGKDIKDNIYIMATFADAKEPPVLAALKDAKVHYKGFYKFNNSAVYAANKISSNCKSDDDSDSDDDDNDASYICKLFWEMGYRSMQAFFLKLGKTTPASLTLTKEVLEERRKLQTIVVELQNQIQLGLAKLSTLHQERDMLARVSCDLVGCSNYEEEVEVPEITKIDLQKHECVTNCTKCNFTCHFPCYLPKDSNKEGCASMDGNGMCQVCPGKCAWGVHYNMDFRFETTWKKEMRTVQELLDRYNSAVQGKKDAQHVIKQIEDDIDSFGKHLVSMIKDAQSHVEKLEQIALKPNPISTTEYIDLLIEAEKMQKRHNFLKRIEMLELLKREVAIISGVRGVSTTMQSGGESLLNHFRNLLIN